MPRFLIPAKTDGRVDTSALTSSCLPCELAAAEDPADGDPAGVELDEPDTDEEIPSTWRGVIVMEGTMTGDGRIIEPNALTWAELPIPLRLVSSDVGAHDGAVAVGRILTIERRSGGELYATGDFDTDSDDGREAARLVHRGVKTRVSVDLDNVSFEVRVAREVLDAMDVRPPEPEDIAEDAPIELEEDEEGRVTVVAINADDEVMVTTEARIRAATLVDISAFAEAQIESYVSDEAEESGEPEDEPEPESAELSVVTAGSAPEEPPAEWFSNPNLTAPTPLTITPEGRIYGHLATWDTCHTGNPRQCVTPPSSPSGYAYFRRGSVVTAEGSEIPTGVITLDTLHAGKNLSASSAQTHYEDTGSAVADVNAGEDAVGIWVSGAIRADLTDKQLRSLRASPLSGDWRRVGGSLELIGALAVNLPGFPIPRPAGLVASGSVTSLVASGMVPPSRVIAPGEPGALSTEDLRYLKRLADRERREDQTAVAGLEDRAAALARRVRASKLAARVRR